MTYDALFCEATQLSAEQQTRLIFELSQRLGLFLQREWSGAVRKRIQDGGAGIEHRGGPLVAGHLAELGAPRPPRVPEPAA